MSFHKFKDHKPKQAATKAGNVSAHESRANVMKLLTQQKASFVVIDDTELKTATTVLPVVDLYKLIEAKESPNHGVTELSKDVGEELSDDVGQLYVSSSQQPKDFPSKTKKQKTKPS